jgi:site-specific DNA-methyltransferase (adenine-specific)
MLKLDEVVNSDCLTWLAKQEEPFADLIFADPPFNIGYQYDVYEDRRAYDDYYAWTEQWITACRRALKPTGAFWIAIGDDYAAEVRLLGRKAGLHLRNWVIWHYTFGQQTKLKFARSHTHLFYFVADARSFTFNDEAVRTYSDRQRRYNDRRANPAGKLPDDTWAEFPRVCGTFAEREGWHPCQMPETVLARIVLATSRVGDVVFDPFAGSGTTLVAAKKYHRHYMGTELSPEYVDGIRRRLAEVQPIADLATPGDWSPAHVELLQATYCSAGVRTSQLGESPELLESFTQHFNAKLTAAGCQRMYAAAEVWGRLESMRRRNELAMIRVHAFEDRLASVRPAEAYSSGAAGAVPIPRRRKTRRPAEVDLPLLADSV